MKRILATGLTALTTAWLMACADIEIGGPDADWSDWPVPGDSAGQVHVSSEWRGQIAPDKQIEIKGVSGDIRAVAASGSDVVVTATKIGQPDAVAAVTIDVVSHALGITICAVYPNVTGHPANECAPGDAGNMSVQNNGADGVTVEFRIQVPAGVVFVGRTLAGDVVATNLESDVVARSMFGNLRVSTSRLVIARSVYGSVVASIGLPDWGRDLEFSTVNGDVTVTVPATTNAWVEATAQSGSITSDFPLTHVQPGRMHGTIGSGGPTLRLATLTGRVTLRKEW